MSPTYTTKRVEIQHHYNWSCPACATTEKKAQAAGYCLPVLPEHPRCKTCTILIGPGHDFPGPDYCGSHHPATGRWPLGVYRGKLEAMTEETAFAGYSSLATIETYWAPGRPPEHE